MFRSVLSQMATSATCGAHHTIERPRRPGTRSHLLPIFGVTTLLMQPASAGSVADNNLASSPPLFKDADTTCTAKFELKPAGVKDGHGYVVVTGPDGKALELRGGPSKGGGGGSSVPGSDQGSSGDQPSGNPFKCIATNKWGVVVPYVGLHGKVGIGPSNTPIYSPDGNVPHPLFSTVIGRGGQKNVCAMANCMMTVIKALGQSCQPYTVGVGKLRNSNTLISQAIASCGVPDPLPASMSATGWGNSWN